MAETDKTTGGLTAEEKHQRQIANLKPFRKGEERTTECAIKGGSVRGEQLKRAKDLKTLANDFLNTRISRERAVDVLGEIANDFSDDDLTNGAVLLGRMFAEVLENGTARSAEFIRDTSGQKPKDEISVTAETMSDADRALMANIAERLGLKPTE